MIISSSLYCALPHLLRRLLPELEKTRAQAECLGFLDKFDDVWILGNDAMKARPGLPYYPADILQTLCKYEPYALDRRRPSK